MKNEHCATSWEYTVGSGGRQGTHCVNKMQLTIYLPMTFTAESAKELANHIDIMIETAVSELVNKESN